MFVKWLVNPNSITNISEFTGAETHYSLAMN
jgi:hypothetical protein